MDNVKLHSIAIRLINARASIIQKHPFFGRLLLHLPFAFEECETAYTDMKKIVFDPSFADTLNDSELCFVILHECMHCVLKHCTRSSGKLSLLYNIACDMVVNSIIIEAMGVDYISIDGESPMHIAPNGEEGRLYSSDEIYQMLLNYSIDEILHNYEANTFDKHDIWQKIMADSILDGIWNGYIADASIAAGSGSGIPNSVERLIKNVEQYSKLNWKQILHDFIQYDKYDYLYSKPDRRFSEDIIMPSFAENDSDTCVDKMWFVIDTSGSISNELLSEAINEVFSAVNQVNNLSGFMSFFDCELSEPTPFESVKDLEKLVPIGGGGTSFHIIFERMSEYFDEMPRAIIIITDGFAKFPDEKVSNGIPVFWIISDSDVEPPWGECVHIYTEQ